MGTELHIDAVLVLGVAAPIGGDQIGSIEVVLSGSVTIFITEIGSAYEVGTFQPHPLPILVGTAVSGAVAIVTDIETAAVERTFVESQAIFGGDILHLAAGIANQSAVGALLVVEDCRQFGRVQQMHFDRVLGLAKDKGGIDMLWLFGKEGGLRHTITQSIVEIGI